MPENENMSADYPPRPEEPCRACGGDDWWLRNGYRPEWLCNRCHPNPYQDDAVPSKHDPNSTPGYMPDIAVS